MLTQIINGHILTPGGWLKDGSILLCDDRIVEVTNSDLAVIGAKVVDARGMYIVPGFVAMNIHGAAGHDFKEGTEEAFRKAVAAHQRYGATTIFPTISSAPFTTIRQCAEVCERLMTEPGSPILGLHLEGPYLNPKMAGAMFSDVVQNPDPEEYRSLIEETKCVRRWDASPELPGAMEFARYLKEKGILVSITHTEAEFDLIREAYNTGFSHVAHFYNAMPGFHKRREYKYEGTVESVYLMDGMTVEASALKKVKTLFDCIYNPRQTRLMQDGEAAGCQVIGGLDMLVWQAVAAQEIWFGRQFKNEQVERVIAQLQEQL